MCLVIYRWLFLRKGLWYDQWSPSHVAKFIRYFTIDDRLTYFYTSSMILLGDFNLRFQKFRPSTYYCCNIQPFSDAIQMYSTSQMNKFWILSSVYKNPPYVILINTHLNEYNLRHLSLKDENNNLLLCYTGYKMLTVRDFIHSNEQ